MFIADVMRRPALTVAQETTLDEVARRMLEQGVGCAIVVNGRGYAQGVLTEKDFVPHDPPNPFKPDLSHRVFGKSVHKHGLQSIYQEARNLTAGERMHPLAIVLAEDDAVERGVEEMLRHDASHLPVLRGHRAVGTVSRHDLLKVVVAVARPEVQLVEPPTVHLT